MSGEYTNLTAKSKIFLFNIMKIPRLLNLLIERVLIGDSHPISAEIR
jgi:hypothetical protein